MSSLRRLCAAIACTCRPRRLRDRAERSRRLGHRAKRPQSCTALNFLGSFGRNMQHPDASQPEPIRRRPCPSPHPPARRPAARLHELAGRPLPGRLARHDPPLDGRRPHHLLPDPRRPAALLARPARRLHRLDAARRRRRRHDRPPATRRLSRQPEPAADSAGQAAELLAQPPVEGGARQLRDRRRRRRRSARRSSPPAGISPTGRPSTATSSGSRERLWIVSRSPGATTSARAVSEWGAMNDTTKPSTPHAITGPPLARL